MKLLLKGILFFIGFLGPLLFSHIVSFSGLILGEPGYESIKRLFFGVGFAGVMLLLLYMKRLYYSRRFLIIAGILIYVFILQLISSQSLSALVGGDMLFGYGATYISLIFTVFYSIRCLDKSEIHILIQGFLISSILIYGYALVQFLGYDILTYDASFDLSRVFSTLGNPALLAFYALGIHIIMRLMKYSYWGVYSLTLLIIFITQTWWAIILIIGYGMYEFSLSRKLTSQKHLGLGILGVCLILAVATVVYIYKPGTVMLRIAIIYDASAYFFLHPGAWFIGFTSLQIDSMYSHYMGWSSTLSDPRYSIGHTHNLFIEMVIRLGIPLSIMIGIIIIGFYRHMNVLQKPKVLGVLGVFILMASVHMPEITIFVLWACILRFSEICTDYKDS